MRNTYIYKEYPSSVSEFLWREVRRIFGPEKDEVTREWRRLHTEELYALYSSLNIIRNIKSRSMRSPLHAVRMEDRRGTQTVLVGRHEVRRRRWEEYIKVDLQEVGSEGMDWIALVPDRVRWRALLMR
jgi:hypothetical protein